MRYLYLLAFLFLGMGHTVSAQDYIVTLTDEIAHGKVTSTPSERNRIFFKADATKKLKEYSGMQIKGYFHNGLYYVPKFWARHERQMFTPSFREGDDSVKFKKATKLDVVATGQINYYHKTEKVHSYAAAGPGYERVDVHVMDIQDNPLYIQVVTASDLAGLVEGYKSLYDRVLVMKREVTADGNQGLFKTLATMNQEASKKENELTRKQIEAVIKEYNAWYSYKHAMNKEE